MSTYTNKKPCAVCGCLLRYLTNGQCIECQKVRVAKWRAENPGRVGKAVREQMDRDPRLKLLREARKLAVRRGVPFDLVVDDVVVPARCPVLGVHIKLAAGPRTDGSPSLRLIEPEKGFVRGNLVIISRRARVVMGDGTAAEHREIADWLDEA